MTTCFEKPHAHVKTVIHLAPEDLARAAVAARAAGQPFSEWLAGAVNLAASVAEEHLEAPWDEASARLFARNASKAPWVLEGRWVELYELVRDDPTLWGEAEPLADDIDPALAQYEAHGIVLERLLPRWPLLVAQVFGR